VLLRETRDTTRVSSGARAHLLMREQLKWHDEKADNSPWINALAELRQRATREGHCFQQVQAITVAIDQYARARSATATTFSTSPTVWDRAPTKCGDTSRRDAAGNCCARSRARRLAFARPDKARHRQRADCV